MTLPLLDPPEPGSAPTIVCPSCSHGIDPHGVDPGRPCVVGDEHGVLCACLWSPNDIAADLMQLTRVRGGQVKARRWWQRRCPYTWRDSGTAYAYHIHYCRLEGTGEPHTHICDCGAATADQQSPARER